MEEQEDTYELAVMRAELLGSAPPDREEYETARKARALETDQQADREQVEEESIEAEMLKEADGQREELRGVAGGLEELTNILSITQNKINKFKTVCGSIKNLFKLRDVEGGASGSDLGRATPSEEVIATEDDTRDLKTVAASGGVIGVQLESQIDKLDSLLIKTENAQMSMQSQNKQMRSFLR